MKINTTIFKRFPVLNTERLTLRKFQLEDADFIYEIRSNKEVAEIMGVCRHSSITETQRLINDVETSFMNECGISWIVCLKSNLIPVGYAGVWRIFIEHLKGELGYALKPNYCGSGYMTEALKEIISFAFEKLKLHRLEANIDSENTASIKLLKKMDFHQDAFLREDYLCNGEYRNSVILSKLETEN